MKRANDRTLETREVDSRKKSWAPPSLLPDPDPEDGYKFRWVRTSIMGDADKMNVSVRRREGWEPVRAEDHPELMLSMGAGGSDSTSGLIEVGGLVLCKTTEESASGRRDYYERENKKQMDAVDNTYLRENDPRMPISKPERSTQVTFGSGS